MSDTDASQAAAPEPMAPGPQPEEPAAPVQEAPPTPTEAEAVVSSPTEVSSAETATAQTGQSEPFDPAHDKPLVSQSEPFDSSHDKSFEVSKPADSPAPPPEAAAPSSAPSGREFLAKGPAAKQARVQKKIEKIMEVLNAKDGITNDEVEKLLHVSDATATRYLSALEKEGKIRQVGKTGAGVVYTKV